MSHPGNDAITIDTIIHAPIEAVWEAWTNPAIILNWFGSDPGGTGVKARMDVHPGGSFEDCRTSTRAASREMSQLHSPYLLQYRSLYRAHLP